MGKNNRNLRNVHEIENNPPMPEKQCVNGHSSSTSTKKKKNSKDLSTRTKKAIKVEVEKNDSPTSPLRNIVRKTSKKKKMKMGFPIIVEDTKGEYPTIPLPLSLRYESTEESSTKEVSLEPVSPLKKSRQKAPKKPRIISTEPISQNFVKRVKSKNSENVESMDMEVAKISPGNNVKPSTSKNSSPMKNEENLQKVCENLEKSISSLEIMDVNDSAKQLPRFYSFRNKVLAIMEPNCKFAFHGKLRISIIYGAVRIYGFTLNSAKTRSSFCIYSPRAWNPVAIESIESDIPIRGVPNIWESLNEQCNDRKLGNRLQTDIESVDDGWAIILLENFDNLLTNFLNSYCPFHLFPRIDDPSNHSWRDSRRAEIVLQANLQFGRSEKRMMIDSQGIDDVADAICYDWETKGFSRTILAGGKSVGKSTTARYLVNKLLAKSDSVIFVDFDPGQAEFTPSGCVSLSVINEPLLGPNFTHLRNPRYTIYLGTPDVTRCIAQYVEAMKKIVERLAEEVKNGQRPIVVNTMGFCKGIGWELMVYIIKIVSPTDVLQILSRRSKNNFEDSLSRQVIDRQSLGWINWTKDVAKRDKPTRHRLHSIYSEAETGTGSNDSWNLEAHQKRELAMISYLSEIVRLDKTTNLQIRGLSTSINSIPPYVIPFSAMSVSLAGAFVPQVLSVMNGNIVALCGIDVETTDESNVEENPTPYPRVLIRPPLSTCYGFGILRGVDMEKEQMYINTPLPKNHMKHVNCLVGCTNLPQSLLQLNLEGAPYTGSEYDLPTSRGSRRGYFRARYQSDT